MKNRAVLTAVASPTPEQPGRIMFRATILGFYHYQNELTESPQRIAGREEFSTSDDAYGWAIDQGVPPLLIENRVSESLDLLLANAPIAGPLTLAPSGSIRGDNNHLVGFYDRSTGMVFIDGLPNEIRATDDAHAMEIVKAYYKE